MGAFLQFWTFLIGGTPIRPDGGFLGTGLWYEALPTPFFLLYLPLQASDLKARPIYFCSPSPATWLCPPGSSPHSDAQVFCLDGPELETGRFNFSSALCEPAAHLASALTNSNSKVNVSLIFQPRKCGAKKTIPAPASRIGGIEMHVARGTCPDPNLLAKYGLSWS